MKVLSNLYLENRFFWGLGLVATVYVALFVAGIESLWIGHGVFIGFGVVCILDGLILFNNNGLLHVKRKIPEQLSLNDETEVLISVQNTSNMPLSIDVYEEAPEQFQLRNLHQIMMVKPGQISEMSYKVHPLQRGEYEFGNVTTYLRTQLSILGKREVHECTFTSKVYPSVLQMKKYELKITSRTATMQGIKKIRRLGMNNEFEQIKNYVVGDDYRVINWKATSRRNELMVNQYQDERSQQVYCLIDKSRSMRMPFHGMSLLDHAINSTLVMSNTSMLKGDKAGILTFSDRLGTVLKAERSTGHLKRILELLYKQKTDYKEANYELLYYGIRQQIKGRSLLLLYTNFDSIYALQRALPLLRRINKMHLLVVVFFENTELEEATSLKVENVKDIYVKTIAEKFILEKKLIVRELGKFGIQSILTTPKELSVSTINKYLELKSRGMI